MKRFLEIDLIKVLALMLMPMSHIYDEFGNFYNLMNNIPADVTKQLGLLFMNGPALFILCLGFGIIFSKNSTPLKLVKRGLSMFVIQAVLNLFRYIIPHSVASYFTNNLVLFKDGIELFFWSDILPFAGFAFLFFALVKKMNLSNAQVLIIGIFLTVIQSFIPTFEILNPYLKALAGYFVYVDETSFFPIISWLIYPIVGYLLGQKLLKSSNKTGFYIMTGGIGLTIFLITNLYLLLKNSMNIRYYLFMETGFQMDFFTTLIVISTSLIIFSVMYFISKLIANQRLINIFTSISININSIYCIHWVLVKILWAIAIIFAFKIEYNHLFIIGFSIFVLSSLIAQVRQIYKAN